jgi:hypothetical protein
MPFISFALSFDSIGCSTFSVHIYILTPPDKDMEGKYTKLTAGKKMLNQRYLALKAEVKEAEKIRKSVYSILRQEQRERQTRRKQDMER